MSASLGGCFDCGDPASHQHHVVPQVLGGQATVPLCESCHGKVHGRDMVGHRRLTMIGLQRAKAEGKAVSRPSISQTRPELAARIQQMRNDGMTFQAIADVLNDEGVPTIRSGSKWRPSTLQVVLGYRRPNAPAGLTNSPEFGTLES